ncbi:hypothetical protein [Longitalea luteola]|uniref:hypothetical protein n=1 Tax=Longitalea luteola TaxID=2812563 RepID=UPI001A9786D4|nr:hypothetical protein [Longitalea luteola]
MRYIKRLPIQLTAMLMIASLVTLKGQPNTNSFDCSRELMKIEHAMNDTTHISFQATSNMHFNNGAHETYSFDYKVSKDKLSIRGSDSTEIIQNEVFSLAVKNRLKKAELSWSKSVLNYILRVHVHSASFNEKFVASRSFVDSGNYRILSYHFKGGPYTQYDIVYSKSTHRIQSIRYSFGGTKSSSPDSPFPYTVNVQFSNYQTGGFNDSVFNTDAWFLRRNGVYYMVAPYENYILINSLNHK